VQFKEWRGVEACPNDFVSNAAPLWVSSGLAPGGTVCEVNGTTGSLVQFKARKGVEACLNDLVFDSAPLRDFSVVAPDGTIGRLHDSTPHARKIWDFSGKDRDSNTLAK